MINRDLFAMARAAAMRWRCMREKGEKAEKFPNRKRVDWSSNDKGKKREASHSIMTLTLHFTRRPKPLDTKNFNPKIKL
jgi:hypothetical protein